MDVEDKVSEQPIDEETPLEESPNVNDAPASEEPEQEDTQEAPAQEEVADEDPVEEKPSRRENLRIRQIVNRLREQPEAQKPRTAQEELDYRTALNAPDDVYEDLEKDRTRYGDSRYSEGVRQAESIQFHTRLEIDAPKVSNKYPLFDPENSEEFNPAAANAINEWYLATAGYDPKTNTVKNSNVRYSDFVEGIMELADELGKERAREATKNTAKQAATTGVRPDGSRAAKLNLNKAPQDMSDEELDAILSTIKK